MFPYNPDCREASLAPSLSMERLMIDMFQRSSPLSPDLAHSPPSRPPRRHRGDGDPRHQSDGGREQWWELRVREEEPLGQPVIRRPHHPGHLQRPRQEDDAQSDIRLDGGQHTLLH